MGERKENMSWLDNIDWQKLTENAQRVESLRLQREQLEATKAQNESLPTSNAASRPNEKEYQCPACAEWIKAQAKICRFCRTEVADIFAEKLTAEMEISQKEEEEKARKNTEKANLKRAKEVEEQQRLLALDKILKSKNSGLN